LWGLTLVVLVPVWGVDARREAPADPDAMNATTSGKRTLAEFGSDPVLINYDSPTAWGDPRLLIVAPVPSLSMVNIR
jgi:hypothetical protein